MAEPTRLRSKKRKQDVVHPTDPDDVVQFHNTMLILFSRGQKTLEEHIVRYSICRTDRTEPSVSLLLTVLNLKALYMAEWKTYPKRSRFNYREYRKVMSGETMHLDKVTEHVQEAIAIVHARTFGMPDRPFLQYPDRRSNEAMEKRAAEERRKTSQENFKTTSPKKKKADQAYKESGAKEKADQAYKESGAREDVRKAYKESGAMKKADQAYKESGAREVADQAYKESGAREVAYQAYKESGAREVADQAYKESGAREVADQAYKESGAREVADNTAIEKRRLAKAKADNSQEAKAAQAFKISEYHRQIGALNAKIGRDKEVWPINQLKDFDLEHQELFKETSLRGDTEEACIRAFNAKINHTTMQKGACAVCFELAFKVKIFDESANYLVPTKLEDAIPMLLHLKTDGEWRRDIEPFSRIGAFAALDGKKASSNFFVWFKKSSIQIVLTKKMS
jgi:hypothetical protein